ncbi:MAG: S41 family peptidase [Proteobacteria bacterium]|nr:S41 family peptidase [Pseudomonadota bacterium]
MRRSFTAILLACVVLPLAAQTAPATQDSAQDKKAGKEISASDDPSAATSESKAVPLGEIRRFVTTYEAVKNAYVEPKTDAQLMHSAVRGLLLDLDPHSVYFDHDDAERFDEDAEGQYEGLGIQVQQQPNATLRIVAPMDGSPALKAGLKSGDIITAIDGKPVDRDNGNRQLRGKAGTPVRLTIRRKGIAKAFDVKVVRAKIVVPSVESKMLEPGFGTVRVSGFQANTAVEFEQAIARLKQQSGGKLRGLVIDLRSNPGGLLNAAVQMADDVVNSGTIVSTRGRQKEGDTVYTAAPGDLLDGAPIVVLVDAGSASASEVLAGALKDLKRARIVGSRTFGKGSVQSLLPLDNGDAVKLTTARYYTPSGKSIQGVGIKPDLIVRADGKQASAGDYRESALPGHLRGDDETDGDDDTGGEVLEGQAPLNAALVELKRMAGVVASPAQAATAAPAKRKAQ